MQPSPRISSQIKRIKSREARELEAHSEKNRKKLLKIYDQTSLEDAEEIWKEWFRKNNWEPFKFQLEAWSTFLNQKPALISVPTGSGKTYAAFGGPFIKLLNSETKDLGQLRVLYISPMKALVRDVAHALARPIQELSLPFKVGVRTGDSSTRDRLSMSKRFPEILVTTPESLAILLTGEDAKNRFSKVHSIIVDEWHELLGNKRGSLLELTLATVKQYAPQVTITGLSATLGNMETAAQTLAGESQAKIISDETSRNIKIDVLVPNGMSAAPWFGYAGLSLANELVNDLKISQSQIIFTNTRAHAEAWYQKIRELKPEWADEVALHHGSLSMAQRQDVEEGVKAGDIKIVVATSSLELGVDFPQVGRVFQVGSAKSLARAVQRAGRGFHRPGESSSLTLCPTTYFEILEVNALKKALEKKVFESREPLQKPADVLVQFLLNKAFGEGFELSEIREILARTYSFRDVTEDELAWALNFLLHGGNSLKAYPQFFKLQKVGNRYSFVNGLQARQHRMNIGTIVSEDGIQVKFAKGGHLGNISESFIAKLKKGDIFQFAGRELEFLQLRDAKAFVRLSTRKASVTTVWSGQILPISPVVSLELRRAVDDLARAGDENELLEPELKSFWPIASKQKLVSAIPKLNENLMERWKSREGHHIFIYPWAGRLVHEGLGHLVAYRLAKHRANTLSVAVNDYGLELLGAEAFPSNEKLIELLSSEDQLEADIESSLNFHELSKRTFREIARIAGLIQTMNHGERKAMRHLQMSSSLLYEVFQKHDRDNLLLKQAVKEVKNLQLHFSRLKEELSAFRHRNWIIKDLNSLSPFSFPLYIERVRSRVSTETLRERIERVQRKMLEGG